MAKDKSISKVSFFQDLFQIGVYKRNQGRVTRQATFAALAISLLLGSWQLFAYLRESYGDLQYIVPGGLLLVGAWISYRIVNYPQFADFLISVEAEMNKVSWPSRTELTRSAIVVIFLIFLLALSIFGFDVVWQLLFKAIGVIQ